MRKFAPGGGAGHFLANAIARRTDAVSRCLHICAHPVILGIVNLHCAAEIVLRLLSFCKQPLHVVHVMYCRDALLYKTPAHN